MTTIPHPTDMPDDLVTFDVRGQIIKVRYQTLSIFPESTLCKMIQWEIRRRAQTSSISVPSEENKAYYIDWDPTIFRAVLRFIDTGGYHDILPPMQYGFYRRHLLAAGQYFNLPELELKVKREIKYESCLIRGWLRSDAGIDAPRGHDGILPPHCKISFFPMSVQDAHHVPYRWWTIVHLSSFTEQVVSSATKVLDNKNREDESYTWKIWRITTEPLGNATREVFSFIMEGMRKDLEEVIG
jgi:hypothetical protein